MNIKVILKAPMIHGDFATGVGNASMFRRVAKVDVDGCPRIPVISGNSLRGIMRRIVFRNLFEKTGLPDMKIFGQKWDRLYAALANGGHLTGSEQSVDTGKLRKFRESLPPLSVFGSALYTYMLSGRMNVDFLWPVCREITGNEEDLIAEELIQEIGVVRHADKEFQDPKESGVTSMPVTVETLCSGTVLTGSVRFHSRTTEIEQSCIAWALDRIETLGGKSGTGFGRVKIQHDGNSESYEEWLKNTDDIRASLITISEDM